MSRTFVSAALISAFLIGCVDAGTSDEMLEDQEAPEEVVDDDSGDTSDATTEEESSSELSCALPADTYTPFVAGGSPSGSVASLPWQGHQTTYPAGAEDFRGYTAAPLTVECSSAKGLRSHLDVTAGCLAAVDLGGTTRGQMKATSGGAFRALALGFAGTGSAPAKWTDQSIEYRFQYAKTTGAGVNPGFKAFARYRSEDDLYVASWRMDGIVQIQKKQCGVYTLLKKINLGKPTPNAWHTMRFDAIGNRLELYLDGRKVLSTTDGTFSWGTVGIRTDAVDGAYLDDWRVR